MRGLDQLLEDGYNDKRIFLEHFNVIIYYINY